MWSDASKQHYNSLKQAVENQLQSIINQQDWPTALRDSVEYSLMSGGKRLRPALVLLAARCTHQPGTVTATNGSIDDYSASTALSAACAIEMIHTYSLIHDDLPSMDDDELRRGRPTNHIVFGEALATLAGDTLLTLAFETLGKAALPADVTCQCLQILAGASGGSGMVGGQILDLEAERGSLQGVQNDATLRKTTETPAEKCKDQQLSGKQPDESRPETSNTSSDSRSMSVDHLVKIHRMKTGALIRASLQMGAAVSQASEVEFKRLTDYGNAIGLAFQIADDLLDVTGTNERLGKETGRDHQLGKLTYPALIGLEASTQKARALVDQAVDALDIFDDRADLLRHLAGFIVERDH
ncbi:MAG: polyprenyl synthetase family protein [Fuerstiella sp.]